VDAKKGDGDNYPVLSRDWFGDGIGDADADGIGSVTESVTLTLTESVR
jgi:hypothetical protein